MSRYSLEKGSLLTLELVKRRQYGTCRGCRSRIQLSRVMLGIVTVLLITLVARAAQPYAHSARLPIWCDGIDDVVVDPFWGALENKKQDETSLEASVVALRVEAIVDPTTVGAFVLANQPTPIPTFLFRPRLFAGPRGEAASLDSH